MLNKKIIIAFAALISSGAVFANGAYVGLGAGGIVYHDSADFDADQANLGFLGELYAGYDWKFPKKIDLGLEGFANITSVRIADHTSILDTPATELSQNRYNYGLRLLPGYKINNDITAHLIAGFVRGRFDNSLTLNGITTNNNFWSNGYQVGLGAEREVTKDAGIRGDVIYSDYLQNNTSQASRNSLDAIVSVNYKYG